MTSQIATNSAPGSEEDLDHKRNGSIVPSNDNNNSASSILDPSSLLAISITLPNGQSVQWQCKASNSFGDIIKQICRGRGLNPSLHVLVLENEEENDEGYVEGSECRPSTLVGLSKRRRFVLLPRDQLLRDPNSYKAMRDKKTSVTKVEMTNRVLVHLPQQKRVVVRISLKESVKSVFDQVCMEKQLYPPDYVVYHPDTREPLDLQKSLAEYNIMEMVIEKISGPGPCESQTLPRRSGAGSRGAVPARLKAKSASKATGMNAYDDESSHGRGTPFHGSSVSLAVDGVHGERRGKKPSKINTFLTFLRIKKKKKRRKDDVDSSFENLSVSPVVPTSRERPTLLSGGRPVSAFIPPESLPAQRLKKRRAPPPPSQNSRLSAGEEDGRLGAQTAVPGFSQSVPALPSILPVQVDIEVDEPPPSAPDLEEKPRRRRAAPRPPTPTRDGEDAQRAPPNFVPPPPPEEPPPADVPVTLKPYHEDKAIDTAAGSILPPEIERKKYVNGHDALESEDSEPLSIEAEVDTNIAFNNLQVGIENASDTPSLRPRMNGEHGLSFQGEIPSSDASSLKLGVEVESSQTEEADSTLSINSDVGGSLSLKPRVDVHGIFPAELDKTEDSEKEDLGYRQLGTTEKAHPPMEINSDASNSLQHSDASGNSIGMPIELEQPVKSRGLRAELNADEKLLSDVCSDLTLPTDRESNFSVELKARDVGDVRVKKKIIIGDVKFGYDDDTYSATVSVESGAEAEGEDESVKAETVWDLGNDETQDAKADETVKSNLNDDKLHEIELQATATTIVNSAMANAAVEYAIWSTSTEEMAARVGDEEQKSENEITKEGHYFSWIPCLRRSQSMQRYIVDLHKTFVVQKDVQKLENEVDSSICASAALEEQDFDKELDIILTEDQEFRSESPDRSSSSDEAEDEEEGLHDKLGFPFNGSVDQGDQDQVFLFPAANTEIDDHHEVTDSIHAAIEVNKTESARSLCQELAFEPEAEEEEAQMEVKLVTPVCSPVKSNTAMLLDSESTDNDQSTSETSSTAHRPVSPLWSGGSANRGSIFFKAASPAGSVDPVIVDLEHQLEHWKDQLVENRRRLEDSSPRGEVNGGPRQGQENLMQQQIRLQQALMEQMEKNITTLKARSATSSEIASNSSICPSTKSVASDLPSNVAPAHVAPKITRQRDQHRDAAKPIFDSKLHLQQSSARAARMAARAERRSESAKSDEV